MNKEQFLLFRPVSIIFRRSSMEATPGNKIIVRLFFSFIVNGGVCLSFIPNSQTDVSGDSSSNPSGSSIYPSLVKHPRFDQNVSASKIDGVVRKLFQKELTTTDVGKTNRLNLPKMSALAYFPDISEGEVEKSRPFKDMELVFYDMSMKLWKFRFVYWKKSGLFAFTRGWPQFVKEKRLQPKDIITFSHCQNDVSSFLIIDVCYFERLESNMTNIRASDGKGESEIQAQQQLVESGRNSEVTTAVDLAFRGNKGFRLFGVQIN